MSKIIITGIYKITSPSGHIYIGQSLDIHKRFGVYRKMQCKTQPRLLTSFKSHGVENHKFEIIHVCDDCQLNELEKYYVDLYNCFNTPHGLNLLDGGGSYGKRSDETKRKNSEASKGERNWQHGKKMSPEIVKRRSDGNRGKKRTEEQKKRISDGRKGKPSKSGWHHSEETKAKLKEYHNRPEVKLKKSQNSLGEKNHRWGKKVSQSTIEKIRLKNTGKKIHSEEFKKRLSEKRKGSGNPMYGVRLKNSGMTGKKQSDSTREKMSSLILNLETGIFYFGVKNAADSIGIKECTLGAKLRGQTKNNTSLVYV